MAFGSQQASWARSKASLPSTMGSLRHRQPFVPRTRVRQQAAQAVNKTTPSTRSFATSRAPRSAAATKRMPAKPSTRRYGADTSETPAPESSAVFSALSDKPCRLRVLKAHAKRAAQLFTNSREQELRAKFMINDVHKSSVCCVIQEHQLSLVDFCELFHYTDIKKLFKQEFDVQLPDKGTQAVADLVAGKEADVARMMFPEPQQPRLFNVEVELAGGVVMLQLLHNVAKPDLPKLPQQSELVGPVFKAMSAEDRNVTVARQKLVEQSCAVMGYLPDVVEAIRTHLGPSGSTLLKFLPPHNSYDAKPLVDLCTSIMVSCGLDPERRHRVRTADAGEFSCLYIAFFKEAGVAGIKLGFTACKGDSEPSSAAVKAAARRALKDKQILVDDPENTPVVWTYVPKAERFTVKQLVKAFLRAVIQGPEEARYRDHLSKGDIIWDIDPRLLEGDRWRFVEPSLQGMPFLVGRSHDRAMQALDPAGTKCGHTYVAMLGRDVASMRTYKDRDAVASVPLHRLRNMGQYV